MNYQMKDGRTYTIRQPVEADAEEIIDYSKTIFASTDQVLTIPEEYNITIEQEKAWIKNFNDNPSAIAFVAATDDRILGLLFFAAGSKKKNAHTGEFGVSVHPNFQRQGVGRRLIEKLLEWAKDNKKMEKIFLNVFATNHPAVKLYKDMGFIEEGRHIRAAKQSSGEYVDVLQMYMEIK